MARCALLGHLAQSGALDADERPALRQVRAFAHRPPLAATNESQNRTAPTGPSGSGRVSM